MTEKILSRSMYDVLNEFTSFRVQSEEGFDQEPRLVPSGAVLWADPEYWKGKRWEGIDAVRFDWNQGHFYVDRETFLRSTRKLHRGEPHPLTLNELKAEANRLGYAEIRRDGDDKWRDLKSWNGFSGDTDVPHFFVQVSYFLDGNRVLVKRAMESCEHAYTLRSLL